MPIPLFQHDHPRVVDAVLASGKACKQAGDLIGVNTFADQMAQKYLAEGPKFVNVGAEVSILAGNTETLAAK